MNKNPNKLKRVVIKEELVALTGGWLPALILNQFLYWSERTRDTDAFIREEKRRQQGELELELTHGWIYKSFEELAGELMCGSSAKIRRGSQVLVERGWLDRRRNPKYKWDRTWQYRPNVVKIQNDLSLLGYALAGYPLVALTLPSCKMQNGDEQNTRAIPEITLETTTEIFGASAPIVDDAPEQEPAPPKPIAEKPQQRKKPKSKSENGKQPGLPGLPTCEIETSQERLLFDALNNQRKAQQRRRLTKWPTLAVKERFLAAAAQLDNGNGSLETAIEATFQAGITAVPKVVAYLGGIARGKERDAATRQGQVYTADDGGKVIKINGW